MNGVLIFITLWLGWLNNNPSSLQPVKNKSEYRAAKYSMEIDFSKVAERMQMPELEYTMIMSKIVSYKYFIQYGKDTLLEIIDPGDGFKAFKASILKLDYSKSQSTFTVFMENSGKYFEEKDSITYSIKESGGVVTDLCEGIEFNSACDSLMFISNSSNEEYILHFDNKISNLPTRGLFYPDIQYLPCQIRKLGRSYNNIQNLEQVFYGKAAIDSLVGMFEYVGYEQITDEYNHLIDTQFVKDIIEKVNRKE